jgi:hypothetical protein
MIFWFHKNWCLGGHKRLCIHVLPCLYLLSLMENAHDRPGDTKNRQGFAVKNHSEHKADKHLEEYPLWESRLKED